MVGVVMKNVTIIHTNDDARTTCLSQAKRYLAKVAEKRNESHGLCRWSEVNEADEIHGALEALIRFASNPDDWHSSPWSFECADSNLCTAENFLGIEV
jgi:hypothetical protein